MVVATFVECFLIDAYQRTLYLMKFPIAFCQWIQEYSSEWMVGGWILDGHIVGYYPPLCKGRISHF